MRYSSYIYLVDHAIVHGVATFVLNSQIHSVGEVYSSTHEEIKSFSVLLLSEYALLTLSRRFTLIGVHFHFLAQLRLWSEQSRAV